jgi:RNA polymerase sigma-70 factor (ECF subfamily)
MAGETGGLDTLIEAVADGDRQALRALYYCAAPRMLGIAMRMVGRRELAEEAVQDAFVAVWEAASRFDPQKGSGQAWLATIVRHKAIDRLRANSWLTREVAEPGNLLIADAAGGDASKEDAMAVRHCMDVLGESERQALTLVYYYGLSHRELRTRMNAPLGTVKSWVRRGLLALKKCLEE